MCGVCGCALLLLILLVAIRRCLSLLYELCVACCLWLFVG